MEGEWRRPEIAHLAVRRGAIVHAMPPARLGSLLGFLFACTCVAAIGGRVTARAIPTWYRTLRKPRWNPPDRVFAPVWTVLYVQMAVAAWLLQRAESTSPARQGGRRAALRLWWLQLVLNVGWSLVFFGRRKPGLGLLVIGLLEGAIAATALIGGRVSAPAGALLVPYLVWTAFAGALNYRIWRLNRG